MKIDNKIFAYGYSGHDPRAFDKTLLDPDLSFPCEGKYLKYARAHLEHQIDNTQKIKDLETRSYIVSKPAFRKI